MPAGGSLVTSGSLGEVAHRCLDRPSWRDADADAASVEEPDRERQTAPKDGQYVPRVASVRVPP